MSAGYTSVQWSRHKRVYDLVAALAIGLYLALFATVTTLAFPGEEAMSPEIVAIRATGSCAFVLLHVILCIGPMARLDRRFLPILYNRRHLGVMTFLVACIHAVLVTGFYHGFGDINPLVSLLGINSNFLSFSAFPFQTLGLAAFLILLLMAATSHDFWLKNLSATVWKRLHMLVYVAYALLTGHVALGTLQTDRGALAPVAMCLGAALVIGLHLVAGTRERAADKGASDATADGWIDAGDTDTIPNSRARTVCGPGGERIAIFKHNGTISAVANVCAHQGGPLGEGKIVDGCITCPWHGWQYRARDGCSPPPFEEKIATYQVRVVKGRVFVNPQALRAGTPVEPAKVQEQHHG
jgi:nitrite reductase/ring-hydroxylating ferredoxin subunit/DMSO/TMAO reductase YedYZ heme-binding membrane subunit